MKVKIGNRIYDTEDTPIMLIFERDSERRAVAQHLNEMENKDENTIRKYCMYPLDTHKKIKSGDGEELDRIKKFMKEI